jgi:hypothetical protein
MDKKFLDKVVDQIVSETKIDYDRKVIETPFTSPSSSPFSPFATFSSLPPFSFHCKTVYGLKGIEVEYVWKEYIKIIKDKIKNNG